MLVVLVKLTQQQLLRAAGIFTVCNLKADEGLPESAVDVRRGIHVV